MRHDRLSLPALPIDTVTLTSSHGLLCLLQSNACYYLAVNAVTGFSIEVTVARAMRLYYPVLGWRLFTLLSSLLTYHVF